jgi:redox-sensitive bicupin YhaK (pirin superfamily)
MPVPPPASSPATGALPRAIPTGPQADPACEAQEALPSWLRPRPADARFHSSHGWLESWHSFSFAGHDHPAWRGFGPLRVINDDWIAAGGGFGMHPHRDMEIITVMVEGVLEHQDSLGHSEALRSGEVQWMGAGSGIVHSEKNGGAGPCRLLQIWIEPSQRGLPPAYDQKAFSLGQGWTRLVDPDGREGALGIRRPVRLWRAQPGAGVRLPLPGNPEAAAWIQMVAGGVACQLQQGDGTCGPRLVAGDGLGLAAGVGGHLTALEQGADLLVFELA